MPDRSPETMPSPDAPEVVVEQEEGDDEQKKEEAERVHAERRAHIERLLKEDTAESRERIAQILSEWEPADEIPVEFKGLAMEPIKRKPVWAARTFTALKTEDKAVSLPKKIGYKGSAFLVAMDNWGKNMIKKNMPGVAKIPLVGTWLLSEPKKTWEELDKERAKKREPIEKAEKTALEKAKKDLEAKAKKDEAELKKAETTENKKTESEKRAHEKMLQSFMTPLEEYNFKNGDEEKKKEILKTVEDDLPAREGKRKASEEESLLIRHMTTEEETLYKEVIRDDDPERDAKLAARAEFRERVKKELSARTAIAESKQGNKKKGKGGGGGKGKGKR